MLEGVVVRKGLVTPANGFVTEEKRTKHAEFGYPVTKFISSDARDSSDRFVERLSHIMTVHQTGLLGRKSIVWTINGINGSTANPGRAPILRTKSVTKKEINKLHGRNI